LEGMREGYLAKRADRRSAEIDSGLSDDDSASSDLVFVGFSRLVDGEGSSDEARRFAGIFAVLMHDGWRESARALARMTWRINLGLTFGWCFRSEILKQGEFLNILEFSCRVGSSSSILLNHYTKSRATRRPIPDQREQCKKTDTCSYIDCEIPRKWTRSTLTNISSIFDSKMVTSQISACQSSTMNMTSTCS
jgi:hypothetical protein